MGRSVSHGMHIGDCSWWLFTRIWCVEARVPSPLLSRLGSTAAVDNLQWLIRDLGGRIFLAQHQETPFCLAPEFAKLQLWSGGCMARRGDGVLGSATRDTKPSVREACAAVSYQLLKLE